jgi:hypothetical protein
MHGMVTPMRMHTEAKCQCVLAENRQCIARVGARPGRRPTDGGAATHHASTPARHRIMKELRLPRVIYSRAERRRLHKCRKFRRLRRHVDA